ncbi:MAG: NUDIX domain-containing protein [Patescibacteria group bacterium]
MPRYAKVQVTVGTVIKKDGKYLLVQERKKPVYGKWNIPAGRAEVGDTLERRAIREVFEETGFRVKLLRKLFVRHAGLNHPVGHAYQGRIIGGHLHFPKREILDAGWFTYKEVQKMYQLNKIRGHWIWQAISAVEKSKK